MVTSHFRTVYPWLVIAIGALAIADAATTMQWVPLDPRWVLLATLTLMGAVAMLRVRAAPVSFSISDTFTFTTLLLLGPAPATITASLEALAISCLLSREQRRPMRIAFNIAAVGLAMFVSGTLLVALHGNTVPSVSAGSTLSLAIATLAAVVTYFLINTWLVAIAVSLEQQRPVLMIWSSHFLNLGLNYVAGGYTALLLALFAPGLNLTAFLLLAPLPLVLYTTVRTWIGRVNDRVVHLDTINRQYRATIDALAHAIDAKDQVTHGHIRRVQTASLQLARSVGCTDESELHALDAASLLHDLGKLAIPEHILNKPGRLTNAEYARMKEHSAIGAEIIAGVEFPYPVAPIVRHHHENFDGSGYPDGLRGEQIPRGARILAIVDCFDALTSDRPYRPAMSIAEAVRILMERRGTMYDPAMVDAFVAQLGNIEFAAAIPAQASPHVRPIPACDTWIEVSGDRFAALAGPVLVIACRRAAAPAGTLFAYLEETDALEPAAVYGFESDVVPKLHIRVGERLSGWVAANRRHQVDADARLDLGVASPFRSAISLPIVRHDSLVGVMTLYGIDRLAVAPFDTLEALASTVALAHERMIRAPSLAR
jgi:putative nucleotidyltransferase with HDIG domain